MSASPAGLPIQAAIDAALSHKWEDAIKHNLQILDQDPENIDALNRLAFAYTHSGDIEKAKKSYQNVIKIDPYNQVAQKNLTKLKNANGTAAQPQLVSPLMFLEEPGKTKIIACINLAPATIIAGLSCGQEVTVKVKKHCIEIRSNDGVYLGALPDDISYKLGRYIESGNQYTVVIRSVAKNSLTVFIREISRGEKYKNQPSFTPVSMYVASGRNEDTNEKPDTIATGEEDVE